MTTSTDARRDWFDFVQSLDRLNPEEFARLLLEADGRDEIRLERFFGRSRLDRLRRLARARDTGANPSRGSGDLLGREQPRRTRSNAGVVVIPGLMGSSLSVDGDPVWLSYWRIALGRLEQLRLAADGRSPAVPGAIVRPVGALKSFYADLEMSLARGWRTRTLAYDWRLDVAVAADSLADLIRREFVGRSPVHLVTHSMGGLVARMFIKRHPELWRTIRGAATAGEIGRLIMMGTPNRGSHLALHAVAGLANTVRGLGKLSQRQSIEDVRAIVAGFPGLLQLLPAPGTEADADRFYRAGSYAHLDLRIQQAHLDLARTLHESLGDAIDNERFLYVAGRYAAEPTPSRVRNIRRLDLLESYEFDPAGDGSVAHRLGLIPGVRTWFVSEEHSALTSNETVLSGLEGLLLSGETDRLGGGLPASETSALRRSRSAGSPASRARVERLSDAFAKEIDRLTTSVAPTLLESSSAVGKDDPRGFGPIDEGRVLEEMLIRGRIADLAESSESSEPGDSGSVGPNAPLTVSGSPAVVRVAFGGIESSFEDRLSDVLAVGLYLDSRPSGSALALDKRISGDSTRPEDRILTQLTQRGVIRGELGRPFFLAPPGSNGRLVAIVGMGEPGRCGTPELTVVVRELCWSLGRLGRKRLDCVLIGAGKGNLRPSEAVGAWLEGIRSALEGAERAHRLESIRFIEHDPTAYLELRQSLIEAADRFTNDPSSNFPRIDITEDVDLESLRGEYLRRAGERFARTAQGRGKPLDAGETDSAATRLSVGISRPRDEAETSDDILSFTALSQTAAVPERIVQIDRRLIEDAALRLFGEPDRLAQWRGGRYLEELIFPDELRRHLDDGAPLVVDLDRAAARIPWEMLVQPIHVERGANESWSASLDRAVKNHSSEQLPILGLSRGLTRRLRSTFSAPAESHSTANSTLRVLIVADPASDARLSGAEEEGEALLALFRQARKHWAASGIEIEVKALIGPKRATRTNVLTEILLERHDILHFAGHCRYEPGDGRRSGWVFSNGELLSASEINRIDRVPSIVFSNACESGLTERGPRCDPLDLAPNFAETFFARGVSEFICTSWRIDDWAAKRFALILHGALLGHRETDHARSGIHAAWTTPAALHEAIRAARHALWRDDRGAATWGAYQHYGSPFRRILHPPLEG